MTTVTQSPYTGDHDHDGFNSFHPATGDRMDRAFTFGSQKDPEAHAVEFSKTAVPLAEGETLQATRFDVLDPEPDWSV
jgi:hypothetical protein